MSERQMIDAMWDDSPVDVSEETSMIWSIANKLRGPYQSDKYKDVIIPMTIIRRFECVNVNHFFRWYGKQFFMFLGNEFLHHYGKQIFMSGGKHFFS